MALIDTSDLDTVHLTQKGMYKYSGNIWGENLAEIGIIAVSIDGGNGELKYRYAGEDEILVAKPAQVKDLGNGFAEIHYSVPYRFDDNYSETVKFTVPLQEKAQIPNIENPGYDFKTGAPEPANAGVNGYLLLGLLAVGGIVAFKVLRR